MRSANPASGLCASTLAINALTHAPVTPLLPLTLIDTAAGPLVQQNSMLSRGPEHSSRSQRVGGEGTGDARRIPCEADENCARQGCSGYSGTEFSNSALYSFFRRMVVGRDDAKGDDYYSARCRDGAGVQISCAGGKAQNRSSVEPVDAGVGYWTIRLSS